MAVCTYSKCSEFEVNCWEFCVSSTVATPPDGSAGAVQVTIVELMYVAETSRLSKRQRRCSPAE